MCVCGMCGVYGIYVYVVCMCIYVWFVCGVCDFTLSFDPYYSLSHDPGHVRTPVTD
jgi:hypothetical protein